MTRQVLKGLVCSGRTFALSKVRAMEGSERREEGCALTQVLRSALWLLWEEQAAEGSGRSCGTREEATALLQANDDGNWTLTWLRRMKSRQV